MMTLNEYMNFKNKKVGNLPPDYGEQMAKKSIDEAFNDEFIKSITQREKQQSIQIDNLDELFENNTINEELSCFHNHLETFVTSLRNEGDSKKIGFKLLSELDSIMRKINSRR